MNYIYKYLKIDYALDTIKNNTIKVSSPTDFNDPFDSIIDVYEKDIRKATDIIGEYYFTKEFFKLLNNSKFVASLPTKILIWFDKTMLQLYFWSYKKIKYFGSIPFFNFLTKSVLSKTDKAQFEKGKKEFTDSILKLATKIRESALVGCFSKNNNSLTMWGHYADNHKGVCIEFERSSNDFKDVKYSKKRKQIDLEYITRVLLGYDLANEPISEKDEKLIKRIIRPFFTKSRDWKSEEEVRCIFANNSKEIIKKENNYFYVMPSKITKIFIGCKVDEKCKEIKEIVAEANKREIEVIYTKESKNKYVLVFENN